MWLLGWTPVPSSFPASYALVSGSGKLVHRARLQKGQSPGGGGAQQDLPISHSGGNSAR